MIIVCGRGADVPLNLSYTKNKGAGKQKKENEFFSDFQKTNSILFCQSHPVHFQIKNMKRVFSFLFLSSYT
jgi:hypothetical protein